MGECLVSVIVPVYNTEKYIEKCIKSILNQTYKNIELILVDDGSEQSEEQLIYKYAQKDKRIKYLKRNENHGLFKTRIEGVRHASGKYIAFVDSDDYINLDFIRLLVNKAEHEQSDIIFSTTVLNTPKEKKVINIFQDIALHKLPLIGEEVRKTFFEQGGVAYVWHTIWNKLYSKKLWDKCVPIFEKMDKHIVMTEDIAFSAILFYYANKVCRVENSVYFYCQHAEASTNTQNISYATYHKRVMDIQNVFKFLTAFFSDKEDYLKQGIIKFRNYYGRIWRRQIANLAFEDREKAEEIIRGLADEDEEKTISQDGYFNLAQVPYYGELDKIKEKIWLSKQKYISFDIFDTVITRPFYRPTDLFYLLDKTFEEEVNCNTSFYTIRMEGEQGAREKYDKEDITIDQIYEYIGSAYNIPNHICAKVKKAEEELEVKFSQCRNTVYELYELAQLAGKKIIFISDMYLTKKTLVKILGKNGYFNYDRIFVSSEYGVLKNTGRLFKKVLEELDCNSSNILHIGDNEKSDCSVATELGLETIFIPKAMDVFMNKIEKLETNKCSSIGKEMAGMYKSIKNYENYNGYGVLIAMVANKYFDNPFRPFHPTSDFNIDAFFMGYYALGMDLIGQIQWLEKIRRKRKAFRIIFTARDGFLLEKAYKQYLKVSMIDNMELDYMYTSRKAMLPIMLQNKIDFINLPVVYSQYTPNMILELLEFCIEDSIESQLKEVVYKYSIDLDRHFRSIVEYHNFINIFLENLYSEKEHKKAQEIICKYWSNINDNDLIYDMGYSGAIHKAISQAANKNPVAVFTHKDKNKHVVLARKGKFEIESMMDCIPNVSGLIREYFFSSLEGSCIGYKFSKNKVVPLIRQEKKEYIDKFALVIMQNAALQLVDDFYSKFIDYLPYLDLRTDDLQMPFEGLLNSPTKVDTKVFMASYVEDKVYGGISKVNLRDLWLKMLIGLPRCQKSDLLTDLSQFMLEKGKKKLAFFGTGQMCKDILNSTNLPVDMFLDNAGNKSGKTLFNKKIYLPGEINDLKELYIIIVCSAYMEIEEQLDQMGLTKYEDYSNYVEVF